MSTRTLAQLGQLARKERGARGLRETALEIGVSPATLMRVENGRTPDVATFGKLCAWLEIPPGAFLGFQAEVPERRESLPAGPVTASAHLRAERTPQQATVDALARMIILASRNQRGTLELEDGHT